MQTGHTEKEEELERQLLPEFGFTGGGHRPASSPYPVWPISHSSTAVITAGAVHGHCSGSTVPPGPEVDPSAHMHVDLMRTIEPHYELF